MDTVEYFALKRANDPRGYVYTMVNYHIDEVLSKYQQVKRLAKGTDKYANEVRKLNDRIHLASVSLNRMVAEYPNRFGVERTELENHIRTKLGFLMKN